MQRRDNVMASAGELDGQLREAQEALAEAIEDLKKIEILEERSSDRERAAEAQRDQAEMDAIAGGSPSRADRDTPSGRYG